MGIRGFQQKRTFVALNPKNLFTFANDKLKRLLQNEASNSQQIQWRIIGDFFNIDNNTNKEEYSDSK